MTKENDRDLPFTQHYDHEELPSQMQLGKLSIDMRRKIWNLVRELLKTDVFEKSSDDLYFGKQAQKFIEQVIGDYTKCPEDEIDTKYVMAAMKRFKDIIEEEKTKCLLNFIVIMINKRFFTISYLRKMAAIFESHKAAYHLNLSEQPYRIFPRTSKEESDATSKSLKKINEAGFDAALTHLRQAAQHLQNSQYDDSVHDSISAVESVVRSITGMRTLGKALERLEESGIIRHKALKEAFIKLYSYTNDEPGIRHALIYADSADVGEPEALFFYNACAAFVGYLSNQYISLEDKHDNDTKR